VLANDPLGTGLELNARRRGIRALASRTAGVCGARFVELNFRKQEKRIERSWWICRTLRLKPIGGLSINIKSRPHLNAAEQEGAAEAGALNPIRLGDPRECFLIFGTERSRRIPVSYRCYWKLVGRTSAPPFDRMTSSAPATINQDWDVEPLTSGHHAAWDRFVSEHPHASPFHLIAWQKTIEESFGYRSWYLWVREGSRVRGILPLFEVKNPILGRVLISTPFAVYGGILADGPEARRALYDRALALGSQLGVQYIELRNAFPEQCAGESNVNRYVSFAQPLLPDAEATLESLPKKTRNLVRKALKHPFRMEYGVKHLTHFERLYATNMRRLGTPCFPSKYFANLTRNFGELVDVRETWLDGKAVAASLNFFFRGEMHIYYAAADTRLNALGPNTFMYFDHLCWAGRNGYTSFDFGRCKRGTGVFEFKRHWNTTMRELPYEVVLVRRKELPNFSPANPRFDLAIRLWRKMPLWLTRLLGPRLIRLFP